MTDKTKEIHEKYAKEMRSYREVNESMAAYNSLTEKDVDPVQQALKESVLKYAEMGLLPNLAKYVQDAITIQNSKSKS